MAANQDLLEQLEANLASFKAAGPAFAEDVKLIEAKIAKVKGEKKAPAKPAAAPVRKTTAKKGK